MATCAVASLNMTYPPGCFVFGAAWSKKKSEGKETARQNISGDDVILANQEKTSSAVDVGGTIERR
jgi:predicted phosphohydrolase